MSDLSAEGIQDAPDAPARATRSTKPVLGETDRAFVLHTYPYRETSLIVEAFTATRGRLVLVAKGAKRPTGAMRGMLHPFQVLTLAWFGRSEMKTLKGAELECILPQLAGPALLSAFYMNELLLKLMHREDPHDALFAAYERAVTALAGLTRGDGMVRDIAGILRRFEVVLVQELGYALQLAQEADSHVPVDPARNYWYQVERGPVDARYVARESNHGDGLQLSGKTLVDMANNDYADPQTQAQSKQLMRRMINHLLGDKVLHTRNLIRELK
jgi:DNA repair protein RecO (recombination protein O)